MSFDWVSILEGAGGMSAIFFAWLKLKGDKETIAIVNIRGVIEELKQHHETYKAECDNKFEALYKTISLLEASNGIMQRAINAAYPCKFIQEQMDCPVIGTMDKAKEFLQKEKEKIQENSN